MAADTASNHPAIAAGRTAVITGAASGIGRAAALRLAGLGLNVVLADLAGERLAESEAAARGAAQGGATVLAIPTDVAEFAAVEHLRDTAYDRFGEVGLLMNNAAIGQGGGPWEAIEDWRRLLEVNLWGVINGVQAFAPAMIAQGRPGAIVNTGSKQGITTPPGNTAYNVSKAGVKVLTEATAHELRAQPGAQVTAHLLIPGFTHTGIAGGVGLKPEGAWTAMQVVDFMLEHMAAGEFYLLCPDNETTRAMDERRMAWAAGDIIENRPALSRWHSDYRDRFADWMKG